jgi:predicted NBD/HSP70 family sugar kinase
VRRRKQIIGNRRAFAPPGAARYRKDDPSRVQNHRRQPAQSQPAEQVAIKEILYKYGPISRADIASMMGLTLPTITTNIAELIAQGMATELSQAAVSGTVGRRAKPVDVMAAYRYVIGVEVAPYRCTLCINDLRMGHMISEEAARDNGDYDEMVRFVAGRIEALIQASGVDRAKIAGVGVGVPGFVERSTSVIRSMGRFGWKDKPMGEDLNRLIGLPVCVENNARVRVIGEDVLNGRIRPDTFAYLFVSLGIACPLMIKNSLFSGKSAGAGEIGHTIMQLDGPKCAMCGKRGCLDSLASDSAILKHCRNAMETGGAQVLKSYVDASGQLTMKEVVQAQQTGDPVVRPSSCRRYSIWRSSWPTLSTS